jgi:hypothetical protein
MHVAQVHKSLMMVLPAVDKSFPAGQFIFTDNFRIVIIFFHETDQLLAADASVPARCGGCIQPALDDPVPDCDPGDVKH